MCFESGDSIGINNLGLLTRPMQQFDEIVSTISRDRGDVSRFTFVMIALEKHPMWR